MYVQADLFEGLEFDGKKSQQKTGFVN